LTLVQVITTGTDGRVVCERCRVADGPLTRLRGLMGRQSLPPGDGLLLKPAPSIHTFFMRFAIDAVFLDADMNVLAVRPDLAPWRMAGRRGARAVLELPGGEARRAGILTGTRLELARGVAGPQEQTGGRDVG
jgi:uncharacterized membrane protein (UPF0127 family)